MDYEILKFTHIFSLLLLAISLTGLLMTSHRKKFAILHGISLIFILLTGFGLWAKINSPWQTWMTALLVVWFAMGALTSVFKKAPALVSWAAFILLSFAGVALAVFKP